MKKTILLLAIAGLALSACGGDSSPAALPPPPPPTELTWNDVPEEITVEVGEEEMFSASLSAAIDATYTFTADSDAVELEWESPRAGIFQGTVKGVEEAAEVKITLTATGQGYTTARSEIAVEVEDPFDLHMWQEIIFNAYECPTGSNEERCRDLHGGRGVEDRVTNILPFHPNFHLVDTSSVREWGARFTFAQRGDVEAAIYDAISQLTGEAFTGRITNGDYVRDEYGWVDVFAVDANFYDDGNTCGTASVGTFTGAAIINVESGCEMTPLVLHEVGHVMGLYHTIFSAGDYVMAPFITESLRFSEAEVFHANLAFDLGRGAPYTDDPRSAVSRQMTYSPMLRGLPKLVLSEDLRQQIAGRGQVCEIH